MWYEDGNFAASKYVYMLWIGVAGKAPILRQIAFFSITYKDLRDYS